MEYRELTSLQHPLVKHLVKLRESKDYRHEQQRIALSGLKLIREVASKFRLRTVLIKTGWSPPFEIKADLLVSVSPQILKKVTGLESPEPIAAEIDMPPSGDLSTSRFLLILDGVSDPGNLGTLLRTAQGLGWDGAFLTPRSTDPYNEKALRAAKGATFTLPWKNGPWEELQVLLEKRQMPLFAADTQGRALAKTSFKPPLALALGNEAHGLGTQLKESAQLLAIPMKREMESLNVASAGAILMYAIKGTS